MDKETALKIVLESYKAYELLVDMVPKYIPAVLEEYEERTDLDARLNRGIFETAHMIMHSIQNEIFSEFPEVKEEFYDIMDKKYNKST